MDELARGSYVKVTLSGRRFFYVRYRRGRQIRRYRIGEFGDADPVNEARAITRRVLARVADGRDRYKERRDRIEAPTLGHRAERHLREHAAVECKPHTAHHARVLWTKHILPRLRPMMKVADVTVDDILQFRDKMLKDASRHRVRHALAVLSKAFNLAERWALTEL